MNMKEQLINCINELILLREYHSGDLFINPNTGLSIWKQENTCCFGNIYELSRQFQCLPCDLLTEPFISYLSEGLKAKVHRHPEKGQIIHGSNGGHHV